MVSAAESTGIAAIALEIATDEMLRRMRDQSYELDGHACPIEYLAGRLDWSTSELCEVLALPTGTRVDLGDAVLVRIY